MYGVPPDLPLERVLGRECVQIGIGRFEIRFSFLNAVEIHVEGRWEVCDESGRVIDQAREHAERECYRVHKLIGSPVRRYSIDAPTSFTLFFENGYSLTVFDDSEQYESFSIQPGDIVV